MRNLLKALFVLVFLTTAVSVATAQNQITLQAASSANSIVFTSTGETQSAAENWTLTLTGGGLSGAASGSGTLASSGSYTITQGGGVTVTGTWVSSNTWNITQNGSLGFTYGPGLLTGNLTLVSLTQTGITGEFNDQLLANVTITGGSLFASNTFPNNAQAELIIVFSSSQSLQTLSQGDTLDASFLGGFIDPAPTGEPASMILVGSGLLLLGGVVRRRRSAQRSRETGAGVEKA
jgi:hypothetical protein